MIAPSVPAPVLPPLGPSMICAGCDGEMVITPDAIGRSRFRCPTCQGVAKVRRHPDDAMLPQGLVKATDVPPRVIREVVRVEVPGPPPPPEIIEELPPIRAGQLRCQLCSRGVHPECRFCAQCRPGGHLILEAAKRHRMATGGTNADRNYPAKHCTWTEDGVLCDAEFIPTGPRSQYCAPHQIAASEKKQREANDRRREQYHAAKRRSA